MNRGAEVSDSIPNDLIVEISSRLPEKSVARFRCVSKIWGYMLSRPYFTELFLTRSWDRPRLLFALQGDGEWSFFSSPQVQNPYDGKVSVGFHMKLSKDMFPVEFRGLTSGLIYFSGMKISREKDEDAVPVIFNPTTRQYVSLPKLKTLYTRSFLGFDPIDKQFKVLYISHDDHRVLTLGSGDMRWKKIQCPLNHLPVSRAICINGVLYYLAVEIDQKLLIVCFDVRSETFKFIEKEEGFYHKLVNYKGKLGRIKMNYVGVGNTLQLCLWVLEDVKKQEWSTYVYTLPDNELIDFRYVSLAGATATGEIVLSMSCTSKSKPFYVFYFNPERKTFQRVEIQGFGEYYDENLHIVYAFVDYVEDLHVNDAKYLKSKPMPKYH